MRLKMSVLFSSSRRFSHFDGLQPILVQPILLRSPSLSLPASSRIIETAPLCVLSNRKAENDLEASLNTAFFGRMSKW